MMSQSLFALCILAYTLLAGCKLSPSPKQMADRKAVQQELGEVSLKADRQELSELRKEIPIETQKQNDELALYLNLMKQGTEQPSLVREKYSSLVYQQRSEFREKVRKLREKYRLEETKRRDQFLSEQKKKRDSYLKKKRRPEETREFFAGQDKDRLSFFADERSRRGNFESEVNAQSKDFDSYMRERQKEFDEQYRLYSKKFSEKPKASKAITGDEFRKLQEAPATPLGTEEQ